MKMILKSFVSHGKLIVPSLLFWTQIQIKQLVVFFFIRHGSQVA
jgi:hypothetical protein